MKISLSLQMTANKAFQCTQTDFLFGFAGCTLGSLYYLGIPLKDAAGPLLR